MSKAADDAAGADPVEVSSMTYEELVDALEQLTHRMADGDVGIEEAVDLYERAGKLHSQAAERLARIQDRIARLGPAGPDAEA